MPKFTYFKPILAATALATLAACGGGTGGDSNTPISIMQGYNASAVEAKTGLALNSPKKLDHSVRNDISGTSDVNGRITFFTNTAEVHAQFESDEDNDGIYGETAESSFSANLNSEHQNQPQRTRAGVETGEQMSTTITQRLNSADANTEMLRVDLRATPDTQTVYYVPRDANSQVHAGGFMHSTGTTSGVHGVFGRRTTSGELSNVETAMSTQGGSATYRGRAFATVARSASTAAESGSFEGTSSATVNFGARTYTTTGSMSRERTYAPGATDTVTYAGSGTYNASGSLTGTMTYQGVDQTGGAMQGTMSGSFYGPNAETMGATFQGDANRTTSPANIVGHTIMNR